MITVTYNENEWQLVPKKPSDAMLQAAYEAQPGACVVSLQEAYDAFLAAAPPAPLTEKAQQWQPIETAPKVNGVSLVGLTPDGDIYEIWWVETMQRWGKSGCYECRSTDAQPSHWMPLAAAPSPASKPEEK